MKTSLATNQELAFHLKGSMVTVTVMHVLTTDLDAIKTQLEKSVSKAPNFFKNMPLVIDLNEIKDEGDVLDFNRIKREFESFGLILVGLRHGNPEQQRAAQQAGLGILANSAQKAKTVEAATKTEQAKLITKPIRSGQQVYARNADLIITASVSPGAEVLADGNIHIYGALRGRALAGVSGNKSANIFCHQLGAELISIAGIYQLQDSIRPPLGGSTIQIYLEEDKLKITAI